MTLRTGNVIESPDGGKWIVSDVDQRLVHAVAFDAENCSATQRLEDHEQERRCRCGENDEGIPQEDCEHCHGRGSYVVKVKGWKHSKVLAANVKEFILKGVKRTWGIE